MSVYIYQPDAFDLLHQVEGPGYVDYGPKPGSAQHFNNYLEAWNRARAWRFHWSEFPGNIDPSLVDLPRGDGTIYGVEGWARYVVRNDGEIVLLGWSATPDKKAKAVAAGFRVSG